MPAGFEEPPRRRIETETELWLALGARVSDYGKELQRGRKKHYVAAGQATLWDEMCWVIVHDDFHPQDRALGMSVKWQPVSAIDTKVVPNSVDMRDGVILSPYKAEAAQAMFAEWALEQADYVLDNTTFDTLQPNVESGVAALWGFGPIAE